MKRSDSESYNQILLTKENFNSFFQDELYGKFRNSSNIVLSRGGWSDSFIVFPKIFSFCLQYTLKRHWTGYSHSLGHKNSIGALLGFVNADKTKNHYFQDNVALTIGNSFTFGIIFKQLHQWFPNAGIVTLKPYYPPIIKSISTHFKDITFVSSLQTEEHLVVEIASVIEATGSKVLFLSNFIGVEGRIFSKKFWTTIIALVKKRNLFLVIDEGLAFENLQYPENINNKNTLRVVSLSKKYGIPGMKLGFMLGGKKFMDEFYDYASTNYGGPLSVFFLLSEFLYSFEHACITDGRESSVLKELSNRYDISYSQITALYDDFKETLEKNKDNFNYNLSLFKDWAEKNAKHFDTIHLFGGINAFIRLKFQYGSAHSFFTHAVSKFGVSVLPGKCLGEISDKLIRITLLEPKSVFKKGLRQLARSLNDFAKGAMQVPKAIFLDFDGTLTNDADNSITGDPGTLLTLLKSRGIFTALATGKGLYFVEDLLRNHDDLLNNYYVLHDGTLVINPYTKKVLLSKPISQETVSLLQDKIRPITNNFYFNKIDGLYSKDNNLSADSSLYRFWKKGDDCSAVYQIYIRDLSPEQVSDIKKVLKHKDVSWYVFGSRRGLSSVIIHHSGANKGKAVKRVLNAMNIREEESVIIGDGINDVPAFNLKKAYKVAMPHAVPEILQLANIVLEPKQNISDFLNRRYGI